MLQVQPNGPWTLVSFCAGGWIAFEIVRLMERRGLKPDKVIMIDLPTSKRMRLHERVCDNVFNRSGIPLLSSTATAIGNALISLRFRWFYFKNVGAFVDGCDPDVFRNNRRILNYASRCYRIHNRRRTEAHLSQEFSDGSKSGTHTETHSKLLAEIIGSDTVGLDHSQTEAGLFRLYSRRAMQHPVVIIYSNSRAGNLERPNSTLDTFFQTRRLCLVGDSHKEAIRSTKTAAFINELVG